MYPVALKGDVIALREFDQSDTVALHKVYGDPQATEHLSFESKGIPELDRIVNDAIDSAKESPRTVYMLAVTRADDDELIGVARLGTGEYQSAQIGFALRADQWGQGWGIAIVRLLERLGFEELKLHRIWGARSPLNDRSQRTMSAAGMIEEGTIRGHLFTRGAWRDSVVHAILSDEYNT
jgi:ribosomal-protein-alanine N-acetyltransferase